MGAAGAAVGTVLAGVVNLLILIGFILHQRIPFVLEFSKHFRWTKESLQNYLIKCFPIICNEVLIGVGNMKMCIRDRRQAFQASVTNPLSHEDQALFSSHYFDSSVKDLPLVRECPLPC